MLKNTLAMIVIGGFVSSNSFAAPLHLEKLFMKDNVAKPSLVSNNHNQNKQFKFTGTWAGACNNEEVKIRIHEDESELSITDLIDEGDTESYSFNLVGSENNSDSKWYNASTHRLTRVNETTLKLESVDVDAPQLPSANAEKGFTSLVYTTMYTVNNNQLTMDISGTSFYENNNGNFNGKCTFKRVG